jgi:eukaryotic-like serine/threonine-protein kinase
MPPAPPLASAGELLAGRYRLTQRITAASGGEVWRGTDVALRRPVAVELLRAGSADGRDLLTRFRDKARYAGSVTHAGIVRIYDYDEACFPHPPFLVMELPDGPSLAEVIASSPLEPSRVLDIVAQVAAALHAIHRAGLVHRAFKPENMPTTRDGQVKLASPGSPHAMDASDDAQPGSSWCFAPEHLGPQAGHPCTIACDLYALGIVACHCLADRPSASAVAEPAPTDQICPIPPLPPTAPAEVIDLISEITDPDPALRPSAAEVASRAARLRDRMMAGALAYPDHQTLVLPDPSGTLPAALPHSVHLSARKRKLRQALLPSLAVPVVVMAGMFLGARDHGPQSPAPAGITVTTPAASKSAHTSHSPADPGTGTRPAASYRRHQTPFAHPAAPRKTPPARGQAPAHNPAATTVTPSPATPPTTTPTTAATTATPSPARSFTPPPTEAPTPAGSPAPTESAG